jgi:hypothetical protein
MANINVARAQGGRSADGTPGVPKEEAQRIPDDLVAQPQGARLRLKSFIIVYHILLWRWILLVD